IGQVTIAANGKAAVLYSNAVPAERLTVLSLGATPTVRAVKLHASVLSALSTPDGKFAVVLHPAVPPPQPQPAPDGGAPDGGEPVEPPPVISDATAFSLVPLEGSQPARIEMTDAPI